MQFSFLSEICERASPPLVHTLRVVFHFAGLRSKSKNKRMKVQEFMQRFGREAFFATVAALALGMVVQRELTRQGVVSSPPPQPIRPQVERIKKG